jgi:hypothetical protein
MGRRLKARRRSKTTVVNSEIDLKPADRVAARVVAPARWYEKPPEPKPQFMKQDFPEPPRLKTKTMVNPETGKPEKFVDVGGFNTMSADSAEQRVRQEMKAKMELTAKIEELNEAIEKLTASMAGPLEDVKKWTRAGMEDIRQARMAIVTEGNTLLKELQDIRKFFLEDTYATEIKRLGEFIDMMERLRSLAADGTMDLVADIILKLADHPRPGEKESRK